jgi:uncharacterized membrane protein
MSKTRIESFSDAVFAIIMTILVLDLRFPDIHSGASLHEYVIIFTPVFPKILSFILSFIMVAIYWVNHHHFFRYLKNGTVGLIWFNMLLLLWLCLLPFPTSLLGAHPTDQFPIMRYGGNLFLCAFSFYLLRYYAQKAHLLTADCIQRKLLGPKYSLPAMALASLSVLFSFVNVYLSLLCFVIFPIVYFIPHTVSQNKPDEEEASF